MIESPQARQKRLQEYAAWLDVAAQQAGISPMPDHAAYIEANTRQRDPQPAVESLAGGFERLLESLDKPLSANESVVLRIVYDLQGKPISLKELQKELALLGKKISEKSITTHIAPRLKTLGLIGREHGYYLLPPYRHKSASL